MTKKIQVNVRLHKEVIDQLKEEAKKQNRSLNNLLEIMIDEYLEKLKSNSDSE